MNRALLIVVVACSSPKDTRPAASPPPAATHQAAIADAAAGAPASPGSGNALLLDACDQVSIEATTVPRALLFSCFGVAIDVPLGMRAEGGPRAVDNVGVDLTAVGATDDGDVAVAGHIDAERSERDVSAELAALDIETFIQIDNDELRGTAVGPAKRANNRVHRLFRDGDRSGLRGTVVTADGQYTLRFSFISALPPVALERRVLPLMRVRPMTPSEMKLAPAR